MVAARAITCTWLLSLTTTRFIDAHLYQRCTNETRAAECRLEWWYSLAQNTVHLATEKIRRARMAAGREDTMEYAVKKIALEEHFLDPVTVEYWVSSSSTFWVAMPSLMSNDIMTQSRSA